MTNEQWLIILKQALVDYQLAIERVFVYIQGQQLSTQPLTISESVIVLNDAFFNMAYLPLNMTLSLGYASINSLDCIAITFKCLALLWRKQLAPINNEEHACIIPTFHAEHWYRIIIVLVSYGQHLQGLSSDTISASHEEAILAYLDSLEACLPTTSSDASCHWLAEAQRIARDPTRFYALLGMLTLITGGWMTSPISQSIRLAAIRCLHALLVNLVDDAQLLAGVTPKVLGKLAVYIQRHQHQEYRKILKAMLQLTENIVVAVFSDIRQNDWMPTSMIMVTDITQFKDTSRRLLNNKTDDIDVKTTEKIIKTQQGSFPLVVRNTAWINLTKPKLYKALDAILTVKSHIEVSIRLACLHLATQIIQHCSNTLDSLLPLLLDTILIYVDDESEQIREIWQQTINQLKQHPVVSRQLPNALSERLRDGLVQLPDLLLLREGQTKRTEQSLQLLNGYLSLLDTEAPTIISLEMPSISLGLLRALHHDTGSIIDISQQHSGIEVITNLGMDDTSTSNFVRETRKADTALIRLFKRLGAVGDIELLLDHFMRLLQTTELEAYHVQCILVIGWLLEGAATISTFDSLAVDNYLHFDTVESNHLVSSLAIAVLQDIIETNLSTNSSQYNNETQSALRNIACLQLVTICTKIIPSTDLQPLLIDLLYPLCEQLANPMASIQIAASNALYAVANTMGYPSLRDLLLDNVDYMMNAVSLRLRHLSNTSHTPAMLSAVIKVTGLAILPYIEDVVEDVIDGLEEYYIENEWLRGQLVHTLSALSCAMAPTTTAKTLMNRQHNTIEQEENQTNEMNRPSAAVQLFISQLNSSQTSIPLDDKAIEPTTTKQVDDAALHLKMNYAERILTSLQNHTTLPDITHRIDVLDAIAACTLVLRDDRRRIDPLVAQVWPQLVANLSSTHQLEESLTIKIATARAITAICQTCDTFIASPFTKDAWPILKQWLIYKPSPSRHDCTLVTTAIDTCGAAVSLLDANTTWQLLRVTLPWLVTSESELSSTSSGYTIGNMIEQLYTHIIHYHSDLVWLLLYTALPPSSNGNPLHWRENVSAVKLPTYLVLRDTSIPTTAIEAMIRLKHQLI
jgi:hypothetical protein